MEYVIAIVFDSSFVNRFFEKSGCRLVKIESKHVGRICAQDSRQNNHLTQSLMMITYEACHL